MSNEPNRPQQQGRQQGRGYGQQQRQGGQQFDRPHRNFADDFSPDWITDKLNSGAITFSMGFGKFLAKDLKSNQIRKVYSELKRIEMEGYERNETDFLLLKPKLAYSVARQSALKQLVEVFNKSHDLIIQSHGKEADKRLRNLVYLFEAILAYHKANHGQ